MTLAALYAQLQPDPWRTGRGFESSLDQASRAVLASSDEAQAASALDAWLARHQPCLFGRGAARLGMISHCVLRESDIVHSDEHVRERIQRARTAWTRAGLRGASSAFVVSAVSERLMRARPDAALKEFARRLCTLYLLEDIADDMIYMDETFLEAPGRTGAIWKWKAGVNYFAANGDGRWWQDHRFPAGIAFSVNSVGHLARSGAIQKFLAQGKELLGLEQDQLGATPIDFLDKAHIVAMQTILSASNAVSGPATRLLPVGPTTPPASRCPASHPQALQAYDRGEYRGYYHTDVTLPSVYFTDAVARPAEVAEIPLDFTYLYDPAVDNPAYATMGTGQRVRGCPVEQSGSSRIARQEPEWTRAEREPRVMEAQRGL